METEIETHAAGKSGWTVTRTVVVSLAASALLLVAVVGVISLTRDDDGPVGLVFTIPAGSKERVLPEMESAIDIPTDIVFAAGDRAAITIINKDDVTHRAGPFLVGPNQTYVQRFDDPGTYPIACTVDPAESIVVTVEA
jgi:hypothetical protein